MSVTLVPSTSDEHLAIVKATAPKFLKGAADLTLRKRLWMSLLKKYGMIEKNASSFSMTWDVETSQPNVRQYGDAGEIDFNQHDALEQLTVNLRGYTATDRMTEKQRFINSGQTQISDEYKEKSKRLLKRINQVLCGELYIDGYATGNSNRLCGINSFLGTDGNCTAVDRVAVPSDTYGGKSTALDSTGTGGYSTNMAAARRYNTALANDFPFGQGPSEYDALSPLLLNYSSTAWKSGQTGFIDNCEEVLRTARIAQTHRGAMSDDQSVPFVHMLGSDLYSDFLNFYSARNRQIVPHKQGDNLGFGDTMNFEGSMVHHEYDCPAGEGYGIVPTMMELFHVGDNLFHARGPEWAITRMAYLYLVFMFGNLRFQPRYFTKYKAYA